MWKTFSQKLRYFLVFLHLLLCTKIVASFVTSFCFFSFYLNLLYTDLKNVKSLYTTGEAFQGVPVDRNIVLQYFSFFIVFTYLSSISNDPYKKIFFCFWTNLSVTKLLKSGNIFVVQYFSGQTFRAFLNITLRWI
jgi:hypothetical protein